MQIWACQEKTGLTDESVLLDDLQVLTPLFRAMVTTRPAHAPLFDLDHSAFQRKFASVCSFLGLDALKPSLYALRHGGASEDLSRKLRPPMEVNCVPQKIRQGDETHDAGRQDRPPAPGLRRDHRARPPRLVPASSIATQRPGASAPGAGCRRRSTPAQRGIGSDFDGAQVKKRLKNLFRNALRQGRLRASLVALVISNKAGVEAAWRRAGLSVMCLRFGDGSAADVTRPEVMSTVRGWIQSGAVVSLWISPPGRTLNAIPCLFRSPSHPWGLPGASGSRRGQVCFENTSARVTARLAGCAAARSIPTVIVAAAHSFVWELAPVRAVNRIAPATTHVCDLCQFGSRYRRRTRVQSLRVPLCSPVGRSVPTRVVDTWCLRRVARTPPAIGERRFCRSVSSTCGVRSF